MSVGDVHWVEFPAGAGRAQAGRRPGIIAQCDAASLKLPTTLIIPLTTQQDALRFPATLLIDPTPDNGLPRISIALVFQMTVLDVRFLSARIGRISDEVLQRLWRELDELTDRTSDPIPADEDLKLS
jgi:mRNA-degrading endonuclease toxin of MazEF toxin-antitoxin module